MMWNANGMHWWGYAVMTIGTLLFWALVVAGIVVLVRYAGRRERQIGEPPAPPTPEHLLAERFARGEIDDQEYRQRLHTLQTAGR